jgi:2-hydroxy-3-oxopropionate reductase
MSNRPAIGFIGLGLMGSAMVERLQSLGYPVTVIANRNRSGVDAAVGRGATEARRYADVAAAADIVMICVDTSANVERVMRGDDGVIAGLKPGSLVIDFGTSRPSSTLALAAEVEEVGSRYMDAPLGRTPSHGREGKLNIMAAGAADDFARAEPVFRDLGENVFHVGPLGAGHTLKLINNFYAQTAAVAMSEAFAMADLAGLPRQTLYDVMSAGPLKSGMMDFVKAYAVEGNPNALAFSVANALKDVGYYAAMADDLGVPSLIAPATKQALGIARAEGFGQRMVPEMVAFYEQLYGDR